MLNLLAIVRTLRTLKAAAVARSLRDVLAAVEELGKLLGYGKEVEAFALIFEASSVEEALKFTGEFLLIVAASLGTPVMLKVTPLGEPNDEFEAACLLCEASEQPVVYAESPPASIVVHNGVETVLATASAPTPTAVPLPLIIALIQLAREFFRR